jgi:hypothetical protein
MKNFFYLFFKSLKDVVALIIVIIFFQTAILQEPFVNPLQTIVGIFLVVLGLFLFMRGLEIGLFPLGELLGYSFALKGNIWWVLIFATTLGYATTIAEPALIVIASKAQIITEGKLSAFTLRNVVAIGVAGGIAIGVFRIIVGHPIQHYIITGYVLVMVITLFAPKEIIGIAYDSGGVSTSTVTVPLITALGIGLASSISGRNPMVDGFGLIAFASLAPMITVMCYGLLVI